MFHDKLENEDIRYKSDLNEIRSDCDKALKEGPMREGGIKLKE